MTDHRGSSAVMAVILMVVITILITSVISYQLSAFGSGLDEKERQFDESYSTLSGNPLSGEPGDLVRVSNNKAGATDVRYRLNFTIEPGSPVIGQNLGFIDVEVTTGSPDMFSNTALDDLIVAGVDEDGDGTIDRDISGDVNTWEVKDGGTSLRIDTDNSDYSPDAGDSIIVEFEGVDNPKSPGDYELRVETNDEGNWHSGTLSIVE